MLGKQWHNSYPRPTVALLRARVMTGGRNPTKWNIPGASSNLFRRHFHSPCCCLGALRRDISGQSTPPLLESRSLSCSSRLPLSPLRSHCDISLKPSLSDTTLHPSPNPHHINSMERLSLRSLVAVLRHLLISTLILSRASDTYSSTTGSSEIPLPVVALSVDFLRISA